MSKIASLLSLMSIHVKIMLGCYSGIAGVILHVDRPLYCTLPAMHRRFVKAVKVLSVPGSSVGIATELRAGRSGIESRWGRDFPPVQTGPGAHPASCKMGTGFFPRVKCGRSVLLTTHPLLVPRSWKSRAIPLPTLWATPGL